MVTRPFRESSPQADHFEPSTEKIRTRTKNLKFFTQFRAVDTLFKTLRSDDAFNFLSIMDHIKVLHNDHFIVFNRTRFSPNDIQESLKAKSYF